MKYSTIKKKKHPITTKALLVSLRGRVEDDFGKPCIDYQPLCVVCRIHWALKEIEELYEDINYNKE